MSKNGARKGVKKTKSHYFTAGGLRNLGTSNNWFINLRTSPNNAENPYLLDNGGFRVSLGVGNGQKDDFFGVFYQDAYRVLPKIL